MNNYDCKGIYDVTINDHRKLRVSIEYDKGTMYGDIIFSLKSIINDLKRECSYE